MENSYHVAMVRHSLTVAVDARQLPQLFDLQRQICQYFVVVGQEFE
jgi:hypothetical protein